MQPREQTVLAKAVIANYQSGVTHLGWEWMIPKLGQGREFQGLGAFQNEGILVWKTLWGGEKRGYWDKGLCDGKGKAPSQLAASPAMAETVDQLFHQVRY